MDYKQTAQEICSKIVEAANELDDVKKYSTPFGVDLYLDGTSYDAVVMLKDTKPYSLASRPEDYVGDNEHVEEVMLEHLAFPCKNFTVAGGIAAFECVDPIDAEKSKCISIGAVADAVEAAGIDSIRKAVVQMRTQGGKVEVAGISNVEYCDITPEQMCSKLGLVLSCIELDKVLDLNYTSAIEKIAQD